MRITITSAEHDRLASLGDSTVRRIVSETTDQIGLGRFVPVNTKADGTPRANTPWFTEHPDNQSNARQALPVLRLRIKWALRNSNQTFMQALVADVDGVEGEDGFTIPPISKADQATRWKTAGGDDKPIRRGNRPAQTIGGRG